MKTFLIIVFNLIFFVSVSAQWSAAPLSIYNQNSATLVFESCSDSNNGVFVVWQERVNNSGRWLLQHVSDSGYALLAVNGKIISDTSLNINAFKDFLISDKLGGFYLGYSRNSPGSAGKSFCINRYDAVGNEVWPAALILDSANTLGSLHLYDSPSAGIVALWDSAGTSKAGWVDLNGNLSAISRDFVRLGYSPSFKASISNDNRLCIVYRILDSLFVNCLDSAGTATWPSSVLISTELNSWQEYDLLPCSNNDLIIAWRGIDFYTYGSKVQRLDHQGNLLWGNTGKYIDSLNFLNSGLSLSDNGQNGCFVASIAEIQSLDSLGNRLYPTNTSTTNCSIGSLTEPLVQLADSDKALVTWVEWSCPDVDGIRAQLFDPNGASIWSSGGVEVYSQTQIIQATQFPRSVVTNNNQTAICTFYIEYSGLYSQFIPITNIINNLVEVKTNNVSVYPNPTVDYFIAQAGDDRKVKQLSIYNFSGQMLFETSFNSVFKKEITTYPAGVYFIKIDSENNSVIKKLFVLE